MAFIETGARVRQKPAAPVEGVVKKRRLHDGAGELEYLVAYPDGEGGEARRWLLQSEVEEIAAPAAEGEAQ